MFIRYKLNQTSKNHLIYEFLDKLSVLFCSLSKKFPKMSDLESVKVTD